MELKDSMAKEWEEPIKEHEVRKTITKLEK